ncbi:MAG: Rieske (2Fe-2S) protein [Pirellulales bacterium]|nr:Rieske (2Fe-2S) protein [Pirellulales bacterium]
MSQHSDVARAEATDRRQFMAGGALATTAMAGGLVAGYGMFVKCAGQYLYPAGENTDLMFVTDVAGLAPGEAMTFQSPTGVAVVVTRRKQSTGEDPTADDFMALSSVCPHLGCRVHWEPQNNRFYCPCHLGSFDPEGKPTGGPPLVANQALPVYPLVVEGGLLYIRMTAQPLDGKSGDSRVAGCLRSHAESLANNTQPPTASTGHGGNV